VRARVLFLFSPPPPPQKKSSYSIRGVISNNSSPRDLIVRVLLSRLAQHHRLTRQRVVRAFTENRLRTTCVHELLCIVIIISIVLDVFRKHERALTESILRVVRPPADFSTSIRNLDR
jgi:hypothetical protein